MGSTVEMAGAITAGMPADITAVHPTGALMLAHQEQCTARRMGWAIPLRRPTASAEPEVLQAEAPVTALPRAKVRAPSRQLPTQRLPMGTGTPSQMLTRPAVGWAELHRPRAMPLTLGLRLAAAPALTARRRATLGQPAMQQSPMDIGTPWELPTLPPDRPDRPHQRRLMLRLTQP